MRKRRVEGRSGLRCSYPLVPSPLASLRGPLVPLLVPLLAPLLVPRSHAPFPNARVARQHPRPSPFSPALAQSLYVRFRSLNFVFLRFRSFSLSQSWQRSARSTRPPTPAACCRSGGHPAGPCPHQHPCSPARPPYLRTAAGVGHGDGAGTAQQRARLGEPPDPPPGRGQLCGPDRADRARGLARRSEPSEEPAGVQ